jgi:uncharacterized protein with HEPN domain
MPRHDDRGRMRHMLEHASEAIEMARDRSRDDLDRDRQFNLSLVRLLEIVGEAAARVTDATRVKYPDLPWYDMAGLRNRLIHGYDDVDFDILWKASLGRRKELLYIMIALGLALFIGDMNVDFLSVEHALSIGGAMIFAWGLFGLVPVFAIQDQIAQQPSLVAEFMRRNRGVPPQEFPTTLLAYLEERKDLERARWQDVLVLDKLFRFMSKHSVWLFPSIGVVFAGVVLLILELITHFVV